MAHKTTEELIAEEEKKGEQVKARMAELKARQKVEERKRLDRAEFAMGNHGFLMKEGVWAVARTPGKYPLSQEMYREQ